MPVIAILTDFGTRDGFVAEMKGVVLRINPGCNIVDITHDIEPGDIRSAAFVLRNTFKAFPSGTIYCAVVDPGVGSSRVALACATDQYFFIGPDNGVLSLALACNEDRTVRRIENERFAHMPVSSTFHGRDIFAPAAAYLSAGVRIEEFGPQLADYIKLSWPVPRVSGRGIESEVVYIDRFGNAFTAIAAEHLRNIDTARRAVFIKGHPPIPIRRHYAESAQGAPAAVMNASGLLEIAVNCGNAARRLRLKTGTRLTVGDINFIHKGSRRGNKA